MPHLALLVEGHASSELLMDDLLLFYPLSLGLGDCGPVDQAEVGILDEPRLLGQLVHSSVAQLHLRNFLLHFVDALLVDDPRVGSTDLLIDGSE